MEPCRHRICVTRALKKKGAFPKAEKIRAGQSFSGTLRFVSVTFQGGVKVSDADLAVAIQYAVLASPVLSSYCSQYGPNTINVDTTPIPFTYNGNHFNDPTLQS